MARAEQYDATNGGGIGCQQCVGIGSDRAGVDVAGMRHDNGLGQTKCRRWWDGIQQGLDVIFQNLRLAGVEHTGDGGGTNACSFHAEPPFRTVRRFLQ